jgi:hypothetical protein
MSGLQMLQMAPRLAVARKATSASGRLGRMAQTRSPRPTPATRRRSANTATWRCSSGQLSSAGAAMRSLWNTTAGCPAAWAASPWRSAWRAKLTCAPGNHTAPGMRASASTAACGVGDSMSNQRHSEPQKASSSVVLQCQRSS